MSALVSKALRDLLDDKFTRHEIRSATAISEIAGIIHDQDKAAQERHNQTLGVLSSHASQLQIHDLRLNKVEEHTKELVADRKTAHTDIKRWLFGIAASLFMAAVGALVTLAVRG